MNTPILAVLVLYRTEPSACLTLASFCRALEESALTGRFKLLIYDNSPAPSTAPESLPIACVYIHDPNNGGLAKAYNTALQMAESEGNEWLLLLDQDTALTAEYLHTLCKTMPAAAQNIRCAALVPKLLSQHKLVSPARVLRWGRFPPVNPSMTGMAPHELTALNSGALLRVAAIRATGGFNSLFWLDFLDHWIFNRLFFNAYTIYVLDAALAHELSLDKLAGISTARYKNILAAEGAFYLLCKTPFENFVYCCRVLFRAFKRLERTNEYFLFVPTFKHFLNHIYQIRRK